MAISSSFLDRLIASINIVDVIGRRIPLERKGGAYWAKCPFHGSGEERTPSLKVYDDTGTYHCFACKESGNAIHFLRKYDGLDFIEAVEVLATQVGMEVPKNEIQKNDSKAIDINNRAAQIFYEQLKQDEGKKTITYLKNRGISGEVAKFFNLGYSRIKPPLHESLSKEFEEKDLIESGLFGKNDDGGFYDRFRDRLMFPIRNIKGECIAFGARLLDEKKDQAKYLNSPETKTYKKKYELYGLYEIRQIDKRPESIFLVEGYMDVIGLFQNGVKNSVASSGTAFTIEQLRKILSYTNSIYIVFDGDEAGHKASWRALENALPVLREDTRINFIFLKTNQDPDSFIREKGKDAFLQLAKDSKSFSDFFLETIKKQDDLSTIEGRSMVAKFALPLINKITNDTLKQAYIKVVHSGLLEKITKNQPWYKKLRSKNSFDDNLREQEAYNQKSLKKNDQITYKHLAKWYGMVETSIGMASETELIKNDGEIAQTLEDYLFSKGLTDEIKNSIEEFHDWLRENLILTKNLIPHNIVIKIEDDQMILKIIDGLGSKAFFPLPSYSDFFAKIYVKRRIELMWSRINWDLSGRKGNWR